MEQRYITYEDLKQAAVESGRSYDMAMLDKAYALAEKAHNGQKRRSGEPYICHPLHVARILIDLGLDTESLCGALLHDVVEDTSVTLAEIESQFGADVARLVDGVTKLTKIQFSSVEEQQAENLRKMLLAMSQDVRVMLIKLCDRLHNMRTGDAWPEQKRRDKALETMEVYAPIAHRLGISNIKEELEDLSLHYLDPVGYDEIKRLLSGSGGEEFVKNVAGVIKERLAENGMPNATMKSRVKSVYGIYRKMFIRGNSFEEIYDVYAVRIILDTVAECYNALGVIHDMFHPLPNRFKDYISTPKPNMYQSLHTTVIGHEGIPFEVQIRTWEMDQMAEYGVAAHWKYKAGIQGSDKLEERLAWVRQLLESQRESDDASSILQDIKSDLLPEEVFAFTPRGDVINLPAGATAIDFAYAIHSAVGNRMVGAKVNNRIVPIDHKVNTGEIIEIITGPADKGPSRDWLKIVRTSEAKNKIRNWFKKERREENIASGRDALEKEMRRNLITVPADKWDDFMAEIARRQRVNSVEETLRRHRLRRHPAQPPDGQDQGRIPETARRRTAQDDAGGYPHQKDPRQRRRGGGRHRQLPDQVCQVLQPPARRRDHRLYHPGLRRVHPQAGLQQRAGQPDRSLQRGPLGARLLGRQRAGELQGHPGDLCHRPRRPAGGYRGGPGRAAGAHLRPERPPGRQRPGLHVGDPGHHQHRTSEQRTGQAAQDPGRAGRDPRVSGERNCPCVL